MEQKGVNSKSTWKQCLRLIKHDPRWGALKTKGQKKQAFAEYTGKRRRIEARQARQAARKAREDFEAMLKESKELHPRSRYREAEESFKEDERFLAVAERRDREEIFDEYIHSWAKEVREKKRAEVKKLQDDFKALLKGVDPPITVDSEGEDVKEGLAGKPTFDSMPRNDRYDAFKAYTRELQEIEREKKRLAKIERRKIEDEQKIILDALLDKQLSAGKIAVETEYEKFVDCIGEDKA